MNDKVDQPDKWKKLAQEVKKIEGNENISDELAERVIVFLREIAELEIRMIEEGRWKNESSGNKCCPSDSVPSFKNDRFKSD